jgi:hypothetical protein
MYCTVMYVIPFITVSGRVVVYIICTAEKMPANCLTALVYAFLRGVQVLRDGPGR